MQDTTTQFFFQALDIVRHDPILSGLAVLIIYFFIRTSLLSRRLNRLTRGGDGKTLEGTIKKLHERTLVLEAHAKKTELGLENLDERLQTSLRGVAVLRFDPFQNAGGQQSFSTALLNERGDGVVLSGIHSRDGVRVYAKEVKEFKSDHELSEEETQALKKAEEKI